MAEPGLEPMLLTPSLRLSVIIPFLYIMRHSGNCYWGKTNKESIICRKWRNTVWHCRTHVCPFGRFRGERCGGQRKPMSTHARATVSAQNPGQRLHSQQWWKHQVIKSLHVLGSQEYLFKGNNKILMGEIEYRTCTSPSWKNLVK